MASFASLSNNWAPSIECINIGSYLAPSCAVQWSLSRDCSLISELTSQVPKNYQDYLL